MFLPEKRFQNDFDLPFMCRSLGSCDFSREKQLFSSGVRNDFIQLFYCLKGEGTIKLYEKAFPFSEGDIFWYLPLEDHFISAKSEDFQAAYMSFDGPLSSAVLLSFHYPRHLRKRSPFPEEIFQKLSQLLRNSDEDSIRKTPSLIMELLEKAGESGRETYHKPRIVEEFVDIVRKSFADSALNINSIADKIGVHRSTLSRLVWQKMHRKPLGYLTSLRMEYALHLLTRSDMPIKEVAKACGLPNVSLFDKIFRKTTGTTPTHYREEMQGRSSGTGK